MKAEGITNIGLKRDKNQDTFLIRQDLGLYVVADGMGGHAAGEIASAIAVKTIEKKFEEYLYQNYPVSKLLKIAVDHANSAIYEYSLKNAPVRGMGTTLTALAIQNNRAYIAHVGDSRMYAINNQSIVAVTSDHSYVGELVRNGSLSEEEADLHPQRNLLTRALGTNANVDIDLHEMPLEGYDWILLSTDGLFSMVTKEMIHKIVIENEDIKIAARKLVAEALNNGGNDNITVVLLQLD